MFVDKYPIPKNSYQYEKFKIHFHILRFSDVIDILRYEKPLRIYFDDVKLTGYLYTTEFKPTGEQEGV